MLELLFSLSCHVSVDVGIIAALALRLRHSSIGSIVMFGCRIKTC